MPLTQREHEVIWRARQHYFILLFQALDELMPDNPTPSQFTTTFQIAAATIQRLIATDNPNPPQIETTLPFPNESEDDASPL